MVGVEFAIECQRRKLKPLFVCFEGSPAHQAVLRAGLEVETIDSGASTLKLIFWFRGLIKSRGIQKIVVQKLSTLKPLRFSVIGLPTVEIYGFAHMILNVKKKDLFHRFVYGKLKKLIALTKSHKENLLIHLPLSSDQISIVPNWVASQRKVSHVEKNHKGFIGAVASRLDPQKGQDLAIQAISRLVNQGLDVQLFIFGENTKNETDYEKLLKQMVNDFGLKEKVHFLGYTDNILGEIAKVDFLIVPSWRETFGRVVIEAMSVGTPVVASNAGGIPDIVAHKKNGLLFETKNANSLTESIRELLTQPDLYKSIKAQALIDSELYTQEKVMSALILEFGLKDKKDV